MKKYFIIAGIFLLAAACTKTQPVLPAPAPVPSPAPQPASSTPMQLPIKYDNKQYGFIFSLPQDWQGYSILQQMWVGHLLNGNTQSPQGPEIVIRHPLWTKAKPYEDIPVMVFTLVEWGQIQQEQLSVSAAPIPPSELGRNAKYVFALPPRFDYDFSVGYQEVEQIMQNTPLAAY